MAEMEEGGAVRPDAPRNALRMVQERDAFGSGAWDQADWLRIALSSIGDAVISTDAGGRVGFMNAVAESLTGWAESEARGRPLAEVFRVVEEANREPGKAPTHPASEGQLDGPAREAILVARDGAERPIEVRAAPMRDRSGGTLGSVLVFRDVAERKRVEEIRARLAAIVESSDDAIVGKTLDGVIRSWNAGAERLFGYTAQEAVGRPIIMIIPPERRDEERDILARLYRGERIDHFETVRVAKDGRRLHISLTVSPLRDRAGRVIGASKIARDITERKRAEQERQSLQEEVAAERSRLAEAFRLAPSFLAVLRGPDHVFELANDRYYQLVGDREVLGKPVRQAVPEAKGQGFFDLLDRVYESGEPFSSSEMKILLQREPGRPLEERYVEFVYQPIRDAGGSVSGILAQGIDLTERKRAEAAVRERDERLRMFLENSTDYAVIITDSEGRVLEWQGGAERITGWRSDEMLGRQEDVIFTDGDRGAGVPREERAKAARDGRAEDKRWHRRKDGSLFFGDGVMTVLRGPDGELRGFGKVLRDATERKRAEEALREADRRKDEFIAMLAHELRNPLAPIRNGLQVMRLAVDDPASVEQARAMMDRQLGHMVRLVDDLLDVSRISQDKVELRRAPVDLADVVSNAVETARPAIEAAGHELFVSQPTAPVVLDADLTRLAQVLSNLLTNSAKYTERGGRIRLSAEVQGDEVAISVSDTGIGIPEEALPRVFDLFSQVDRANERASGGLGIGLALVKGLVEMHGGTVTAESEGIGKGSTFTVRLPLPEEIDAAPPSTAPEDAGPIRRRHGRRILVVDDNEDSARTMARVLTLLGDEVRVAHDGFAAVEEAESFRPEAILMDVGMPRMNGYEAARLIRARPWAGPVIIIALTGWGQEGDRVRSREAGCDGHLVKPVDLNDLQRLLDELTGAGPATGGAAGGLSASGGTAGSEGRSSTR